MQLQILPQQPITFIQPLTGTPLVALQNCGKKIPLNGDVEMIAKDNVTIGIEWRFGPDWPGQRCGAKTRRGAPCRRPANKRNGRCRLHGGASSGPRTEQGRAKIAAANTTTGQHTKVGALTNLLSKLLFSMYLYEKNGAHEMGSTPYSGTI